jgi:hypothetical protein
MLHRGIRTLLVVAVFGWAGSAGAQPPGPAPDSGGGPVVDSSPVPPPLPLPPSTLSVPIPTPPAACSATVTADNGCWQQGLLIGVGLHVLRPVVSNNQGLILTAADGGGTMTAGSVAAFDYGFSAAPSVSFGYTGDSGLGVQVTWFQFSQSAGSLNAVETPLDPAKGGITVSSASGFLADATVGAPKSAETNIFHVTDHLRLATWDFDVTQKFRLGMMDMSAGAGVRYLHLTQGFRGGVQQTGLAPGGLDEAFEATNNDFDGAGPTLLLEAYRPIGSRGLAFYANARTGLLFGSRHEVDYTLVVTNPGNGGTTNVAPGPPVRYNSDQTVGFAEFELGLEWAQQYQRFCPFARVGFEAREYLNTGNAQSLYVGHNSDLGLVGFVFRVGVDF